MPVNSTSLLGKQFKYKLLRGRASPEPRLVRGIISTLQLGKLRLIVRQFKRSDARKRAWLQVLCLLQACMLFCSVLGSSCPPRGAHSSLAVTCYNSSWLTVTGRRVEAPWRQSSSHPWSKWCGAERGLHTTAKTSPPPRWLLIEKEQGVCTSDVVPSLTSLDTWKDQIRLCLTYSKNSMDFGYHF